MSSDKSFLGTGWGFPPQFDQNARGVIMISKEDDIGASLRILLNTTPGERPMQPTYGCGLREILFDSVTESTMVKMKDIIERAILFFEPRINLNSIVIDDSEQHNGILKINIDYTVRETNSRGNMVYPFYFKEGTHVPMDSRRTYDTVITR